MAPNKKIKKRDLIQECIDEFDLFPDRKTYRHFEFCLLDSSTNVGSSVSIAQHIKLFDLCFQIEGINNFQFSFLDLKTFVLVNSKDQCFLIFIDHEVKTCFKLLFLQNEKLPKKFSFNNFEPFINIFDSNRVARYKKILKIEGSFDLLSLDQLTLNISLDQNFVFYDFDFFQKNFATKNDIMIELMSFFCDYPIYSNRETHYLNENLSFEEFYSILHKKKFVNEFTLNDSVQHENLIPTLRPYQESAVKWMLYREKFNRMQDYQDTFVKHTFMGIDLYYLPSLGHFVSEEVHQEYIAKFKVAFGGILADEMGLGKTVETLALILNHTKSSIQEYKFFNKPYLMDHSLSNVQGFVQCYCGNANNRVVSVIEDKCFEEIADTYLAKKYYLNGDLIKCLLCGNYQHLKCSNYQIDKDDFPYLCSRCWLNVDQIDSKCTLIVCPNSILQQWLDEALKHVRNIKIYQYNGIKARDYHCSYIFPPILANYDIILTSYDTLRSEIDFCSSDSYRLRTYKRYYSPLSPLLAIKWWRLCFDEAQLVEGTYSKAAQMANALTASYRWAITGTPIQSSVTDLYGLLYFIGEQPFNNCTIWNKSLYFPYCNGDIEPLINAVKHCFWRTPKNEVLEEIGISKPKVSINYLEFSQIERDYYLRQASLCQTTISEHLKRVDSRMLLSDLSSTLHSSILNIALRLRQICCHPQISTNMPATLKKFNSLQDVLDKMIEDNKYDCEKDHREIIASFNGIASVYIQSDNFRAAIEHYKAALNSVDKYKEFFRTDKTQVYHIYYNLAEILELFDCIQVNSNGEPYPAFNGTQLSKSNLSSTQILNQGDLEFHEEDKSYRMKAKQMYDDYILNAKLSCLTTGKYRTELINKCNDLQQNSKLKGKWFIYALNVLSSSKLDLNEVYSIINHLHSNFDTNHSVHSMQFTLSHHISDLENSRKSMIEIFQNLQQEIINENQTAKYIECHIKRTAKSKCCLCKAESKFRNYERNLFNIQYNFDSIYLIDEVGDKIQREGNWNESNFIIALKKIGQLFKTKVMKSSLDYDVVVQDIDNFLQYVEELKKEFRIHRKYWTNLSEFICRIDELDQAQQRFVIRFFHPNDTLDDALQNSNELNSNIVRFKCDMSNGDRKLQSNLNRYRYLINLKNSLKNKDDVESRVCSICWCDLVKYFVLTCGHFFCIDCILQIEKHYGNSFIKCSICRMVSRKDTLCCIDTELLDTQKIQVNGNWSTKIVHIIRTMKKILESDEKILVFSTWPMMLEIMQRALDMNDIRSVAITRSKHNFAYHIKCFQSSKTDNVLLLSTNYACNGLNLIEASHIIFINSSLNKSDELQAIGRIFRIGQTRQTHVHKFIIKDSIEELIEKYHENMYQKQKSANSEFNNLTVQEFVNLFGKV